MKSVIQEWKVRRKDFCISAGILAGVWAAGMILAYVLRVYCEQENSLIAGSMLAAAALVGTILFGFGADFLMTYDLAAGFGKPRKKFLKNVFAVYFTNGILFALEVRLLLEGEIFIGKLLYPGTEILHPDSVYLSLPWIFILIVLLTGLAVFGGMIVHKFRAKAVVALLILWLMICLEIRGETTISRAAIEGFFDLTVEKQLLMTALVGITALTSAALAMKKEPVRG